MEDLTTLQLAGAAAATIAVGVKLYAAYGGPRPAKCGARQPASHHSPAPKRGQALRVTDPTKEAAIRLAPDGLASISTVTMPALFKSAAERHPDKPALKVERGGEWVTYTWKNYFDESCKAARGFIALGLEPHTCVNIIGFNCPEWFMSQMGALLAGGISAGVYSTNDVGACQYVAEHSEARFIALESGAQLDKYAQFADKLPHLKALVMWGDDAASRKGLKTQLLSWDGFLGKHTGTPAAALAARWEKIRPGHCASLCYTSGTTGQPKAVMSSHDNLYFEAATVFRSVFTNTGLAVPVESRVVSYLPLSHVAAQVP